jgi:hypothetical protein
MHDNDVLPINPVSPSHNELLVQATDGGGPAHCVVLPSGIDGVDKEGNAPIPTLENINTLNATPCKGYIHASLASGSPHHSIPCLHEIEV